MIIWINGAFGAGKSQTAWELHRRLPNSYVFDPENAGYFIRKNLPNAVQQADDFQDYPMWREINYAMLSYISRTYKGVVIVPMTIVNPKYFEQLIGRLRNEGALVHHFTLCASKETLLTRLRGRGDGKSSWPAKQLDRCLAALSSETFQYRLDTEQLTILQAAESIASLSGIELVPDQRGFVRKKLDRWMTQLKQIRF